MHDSIIASMIALTQALAIKHAQFNRLSMTEGRTDFT